MSKELILLDDVEGLGKIGEQVKVSDGYARNYLLPRHLAEPISKGALRQVEVRKLKLQKEREARIEVAKAMAKKIEALSIVMPMAVGENDKLFGSVNAQLIVDAVKAQGIEIDKNCVVLPDNIRTLGEYKIELKLNPEVKAALKVTVTKKEDAKAAEAPKATAAPKAAEAPKAEEKKA